MMTEHDNSEHKCDNDNDDCNGAISYSPRLGWLCRHHAYQSFLLMRVEPKRRNVVIDVDTGQMDMFDDDE